MSIPHALPPLPPPPPQLVQHDLPEPGIAPIHNARRHPNAMRATPRTREVCRDHLKGYCRKDPCPWNRIHLPREDEAAVPVVAGALLPVAEGEKKNYPGNSAPAELSSLPPETAKTAETAVFAPGTLGVAVSLPPTTRLPSDRAARSDRPLIQLQGREIQICFNYLKNGYCIHGDRCYRLHILPDRGLQPAFEVRRDSTYAPSHKQILGPQGFRPPDNNLVPMVPQSALPPRMEGPKLDIQNGPLLRQEPNMSGGTLYTTEAHHHDGLYKVFDEKHELAQLVHMRPGTQVAVRLPQQYGGCDPRDGMRSQIQYHPNAATIGQSNQYQEWPVVVDHTRRDSNTTASNSEPESLISEGSTDRQTVATSSPSSPEVSNMQCPNTDAPRSVRLQIPHGVCVDWIRGKCWRQSCKFSHSGFPRQLPGPPQQECADAPKSQISCNPIGLTPIEARTAGVHARDVSVHLHQAPTVPQHSSAATDSMTGAPAPSHPPRLPTSQSHAMPNRIHPAIDQSRGPVKRRGPEAMTIGVLDHVKVSVGAGFNVEKVVTSFDTLWINMWNLPTDLPREKIENLLKPFGTVMDIHLRERDHGAVRDSVSIKMSSPTEASAVAESLDDVEIWGGHIRVRLSLGRTAQDRVVCDSDVHVMWPAPVKGAYAGYMTQKAAEKVVAKMDGKILNKGKYFVTASLFKGLPCQGPFNVRFWGLPVTATKEVIDKLGENTGVMLDRPKFKLQEFGAPVVESILKSIGKMSPLQVSPPPYKDGMVHGWVRYQSPDLALLACELDGMPQERLKQQKIWVQRVHSVTQTIPRFIYDVIGGGIQRLRHDTWKYARETNLYVNKVADKATVMVKIVSQDKKTLVQVKSKLNELVRGELLQADGVQLWDGFFTLQSTQAFLEDMEKWYEDVLIRVDRIRRTVRLVGRPEKCQLVRSAILDKLLEFRSLEVHTVDLSGRMIGLFMNGDLRALQEKHGRENVWLDLKQRVIHVRGNERVLEAVQQAICLAQKRHPDGSGNRANVDPCPVCFEDPTNPVILDCSHVFCKPCLERYLQSAIDTRRFPLTCLGAEGTCGVPISLYTARDVLTPDALQSLARAAFHAYVQAHPDDYHYCPTPDCAQVYRPGPRDTVLACPDCLTRICPHCAVEYHEGVTCLDREIGIDGGVEVWAAGHGAKRCPGCKAMIERSEGCNHMTCTRCHTHMCFVCLETFPRGEGIYDHMRLVHGSLGL